ncbi:hypothetical protein ED208_12560 [Stagnimonas aquatica]|uniref:DUF3102 domain-containing protein n=1 Tax=Stagnimonas aquatica TaxID=2689987 RepID=A0A3N0V7U2_9GAMM|nr:hypothetical protein [Stagnimonas aquatica]ROH88644.1 hypothetical protein ED208_12560 [Stagnimonas aquatica]
MRKNELAKSRDVAAFELNPAQMGQLAEIARADLQGSDETLAALGAEELGRAEMSVLRAGAYFLKLKEQAGHGGFIQALNSVGVSPDRAQRSMQMARYVASLPADQARRIAALPRSKVLPLVNADQEVVGELLEQGALDGEQPLSVRELQDRLRKSEAEKATLKTRLETAQAEKIRLARERSRVLAEEDLPAFALEARQEALALTEQMGFGLDSLQDIVEQNLLQRVKHPEADRFQPLAAGTTFHALAAVHARAGLLLSRLQAHFGEAIADPDVKYSLSPAEAQLFIAGRERLLSQQQADAKTRANKRANDTPGKPGRKRGPASR